MKGVASNDDKMDACTDSPVCELCMFLPSSKHWLSTWFITSLESIAWIAWKLVNGSEVGAAVDAAVTEVAEVAVGLEDDVVSIDAVVVGAAAAVCNKT